MSISVGHYRISSRKNEKSRSKYVGNSRKIHLHLNVKESISSWVSKVNSDFEPEVYWVGYAVLLLSLGHTVGIPSKF